MVTVFHSTIRGPSVGQALSLRSPWISASCLLRPPHLSRGYVLLLSLSLCVCVYVSVHAVSSSWLIAGILLYVVSAFPMDLCVSVRMEIYVQLSLSFSLLLLSKKPLLWHPILRYFSHTFLVALILCSSLHTPQLLELDVKKRLGCSPTGWAEVKAHPWFEGTPWDKMARLEIEPPHKPHVRFVLRRTLSCNDSSLLSPHTRCLTSVATAVVVAPLDQSVSFSSADWVLILLYRLVFCCAFFCVSLSLSLSSISSISCVTSFFHITD